MEKGFWNNLNWPIVGLSPMDGVTDAAFRHICAKHGSPDVVFTEFTSVEGIRAGATRLLDDFLYDPIERPVVAQIFGAEPEAFFQAAVIVSALGFDGIDINMGCPSKNITGRGAGAALILDPERAKEIIRQTRAGAKAWSNGMTLSELEIPQELLDLVTSRREQMGLAKNERIELPVSVKTRVGHSEITIEEWVKHILEEEPVVISIHGRTLKQGYTGLADWEAIHLAENSIHQTETKILGNGDILSMEDAANRIKSYNLDGVLVGRATFGNPWLFKGYTASLEERLAVALEHAEYYDTIFPPQAFVRMRKHLLDYVRGFEGAKELRGQLMRVKTIEEVRAILKKE